VLVTSCSSCLQTQKHQMEREQNLFTEWNYSKKENSNAECYRCVCWQADRHPETIKVSTQSLLIIQTDSRNRHT